MNNMNWLITEVLSEQRESELASIELRMRMEAERVRPQANLRRTLAGGLVRLGMRIDPAAGERALPSLSLSTEKGGQAR
jgi:hypothetical protein